MRIGSRGRVVNRARLAVRFQQVFKKVEKAREAEGGIDVMFDDVECEIIGAGETPDRQGNQNEGLRGEVLGEQKKRRGEADDEEHHSLAVDRDFALEISHCQIRPTSG